MARTLYGKRKPLADRFWNHVDKNGPIHPVYGQCWTWTRQPGVRGYGFVSINYKKIYAHRYSYEIANSVTLVSTECVLHKCDNPLCVNPDHLFVGTRTSNSADKVVKDRQAKGETFTSAKLTASKVKEIRQQYRLWSPTRSNAKQLAAKFGVSPRLITNVVKGKRWRHVN